MRKMYLTFLLVFTIAFGLKAQWLWDINKMQTIKNRLTSIAYAPAYEALIFEAEKQITRGTYSVVQKEGIAPSGDKHDYVSLSRYWWPDPNTPNGLPYINKDGRSNPELDNYDRNTLGKMCSAVNTLSLAFFYSGQEAYAQKAVTLIQDWFLDSDTRMNPNLEYAQFIPGRDNSKGRSEGLIDTYSFVGMLSSIQLLKGSKAYTQNVEEALQQWFREFIEWMKTSKQGKKEEAAKNNHATAYDSQLITYLLFSGNEKAARKVIDDFPAKRIFAQIEPDGRQPNELWRTLAYHYSEYNLSHMLDVCATAKKIGVNLLDKQSDDGRSIYAAMDYIVTFLGKDVSSWPYKQISGWEAKQQDICKDLIRILALDSSRRDPYIEIFRKYAQQNPTDRWRLLYDPGAPIPDGNDNVFLTLPKRSGGLKSNLLSLPLMVCISNCRISSSSVAYFRCMLHNTSMVTLLNCFEQSSRKDKFRPPFQMLIDSASGIGRYGRICNPTIKTSGQRPASIYSPTYAKR